MEKPWDQPICQMNITGCFFNFPFSSDVRKTSEKNKIDSLQNGYSSVGKTGKIKKTQLSMNLHVISVLVKVCL